MKLSTNVKPISYLKDNAEQIIKDITESREPLLITQNGESKLVVMDVKTYEDNIQTLLMLKILVMGQSQIKNGQFRSSDEVFAEME
ncbi:type II toxin-antitoxin system Phd/YefM family antitoxin [Methylotenera sp.]|uniref:type II toxin-antitoxin system Phd/YefM family antitoxin n=1 Tax=Methylotenera sp. TaxID=2051956 RepID=UPI002735DCEE|nr:type II toxin-antitoxin system Phd/YefM family antitoxin [Methylotenera sp.]MDP3210649.1 type II toxin-antitoxin system Phd/YefM family antitoxin [Methylotenera sp.]